MIDLIWISVFCALALIGSYRRLISPRAPWPSSCLHRSR